jgi:Fe-S oxidoreductase
LAALAPFAAAGVPIIGLEPSCLLTLRDEYLDLFPDDSRAQAVAAQALLIEEFLTRPDARGQRPVDCLTLQAGGARVLLHGHCHAKALVGNGPMLAMLQAAGAMVTESGAGCCGMAGSFGYEKEHYGLSQQVAELALFPAVWSRPADQVLAAGMSCRSQIGDGTGRAVRHPIQVIDEWLVDSAD